MLAANPTQGQHVTFPRYWMFSKAWMLRSWRFKRCQGDLGVKPFQGDMSIVRRPQAAPALPTPRGLSAVPLEQRHPGCEPVLVRPQQAVWKFLQPRVTFGLGSRTLDAGRTTEAPVLGWLHPALFSTGSLDTGCAHGRDLSLTCRGSWGLWAQTAQGDLGLWRPETLGAQTPV